MKLAVFGITGGTGRNIAELALKEGHEVVALARKASDVTLSHPKLKVVEGQALQQADVEKVIAGADAVLSGVGARTLKKNSVRSDHLRAVLGAMKATGVKRFVWLSASGVADSADQARRSNFIFGRIIMPLLLKDAYADHAVGEGLVRESGLDWTVVRPVGLNDKPAKGRVDVIPLDQKVPRSYVSREDVARFMLDAAVKGTYVRELPVIC